MGFSSGLDGKESSCSVGDLGSIPESKRSPGEGNGYLLQYSFFFFNNINLFILIQGEGNGNPLQCSFLENSWTEEPGGLQSMGLQRVCFHRV